MENKLVTRHDQTPLVLANEFMKGVKDVVTAPDSPLNTLFDNMCYAERKGTSNREAVNKQLTNVNGTKWDIHTSPIFEKKNIKISLELLAWIAMGCSANPSYVDIYVGMIATVFYSKHPKGSEITLDWLGRNGFRGIILSTDTMLPWMLSSKTEEGKIIYLEMKDEDYFTFKEPITNE